MNNKLEIIETPDYILAVSDEDIKQGDWYLATNTIEQCSCKEEANDLTDSCKKIIAYQPKGNAPELDLPLLPGYKAATKVYSEEDLREAFNAGYDLNTWEQLEIPNEERDYLHEDDYIQSLKQPKTPKWFVAEMEYWKNSKVYDQPDTLLDNPKPKTTTVNNKKYLIGTYLYE